MRGKRRETWEADGLAPHMHGREGDRDQKFPRVWMWKFGLGLPRWGVVVLAAAVLTLAGYFFLGLPAAGFGAAVGMGSGFSGLAVFLVAVTLGCSDASVTIWEGFGLGSEMVVALTARPFGRHDLTPRPGPSVRQKFRSGRMAFGCSLSANIGRLLYKSRLSFFPLYTTPVVRRVVSPAATALGLFPRGRTTGEVGAATRDAAACVCSFAACVQSAGSACIAMVLPGPGTIPPTLAKQTVSWEIALSTPQALAPLIQLSGGGRAILGEVLVATAGSLLRDSLDKALRAPTGRRFQAYPYTIKGWCGRNIQIRWEIKRRRGWDLSWTRKSSLSIRNGVLLYKQLIRPMIDYACPVWRYPHAPISRNCKYRSPSVFVLLS